MLETLFEKILGTFQTPKGLSLELIAMQENHLEQLVTIETAAHESPWNTRLFSDCLTGRQKCFVVLANKASKQEIVAYIVFTLAGPDAEILNITVASAWQKKGIGRCLLQRSINTLKPCCEIVYLEVRESNAQAIELYASEGFVEVGVRSNYYPAKKGREDAIIFAYTLMDSFS